MGEKSPENKEKPNKSETKPQSNTDTVRKIGETAIKGGTDKRK